MLPFPTFSRRTRRALIGAAGIVIAVLMMSWLVLPIWLKQIVQDKATQALGRQVSLEAAHVNPLTLTVGVDHLVIAGRTSADAPLLRLAHAQASADLRSLWRGAPVVRSILVQGPDIRLARVEDGHYDIDDVLARISSAPPKSPAPEPARFALYNLRVEDGHIRFDDRPKARVHEVQALQLGIPFLSNLDDAVEVKVQPRLAFTLDGTSFDTGAQATPFAQQRAGELSVKTGDIDLSEWLPYMPADLPVKPAVGHVALDAKVAFRLPSVGTPEVIVKGAAKARSVKLVGMDGEPWVVLEELSLPMDELRPLQHRLRFGDVTLAGLAVTTRRDAASHINWLQAMAAPPAQAASAASAPSTQTATPWVVSASGLTLRGTRLEWHDEAVAPSAHLAVDDLALHLDEPRWPVNLGDKPTRLQATAVLRNLVTAASAPAAASSAPSLSIDGQWDSTAGSLRTRGDAWPIEWAGAYLSRWVKPRLAGRLAVDAKANWVGAPGASAPTAEVASLRIDDFRATGPAERLPALGWKRLAVEGLAVDAAQRKLSVGRWSLDQPIVRAHRHQTGQVDLHQWLVSAPAADSSVEDVASEPAWSVELQESTVDNGKVSWIDDAVSASGPVSVDLAHLNVTANGLRWPANPKSPAKLRGAVQIQSAGAGAAGQLAWQGEVGLSPPSWKGKVRAERVPVHVAAAYAGDALPVFIARADAGWVGDVDVRVPADGLRLAMQGEARVTDLSLYPRWAPEGGRGDELLSWQAFVAPGVKVNLAPHQRPRIEVGEASVTDLFARLNVSESGHFNLADLNPPPSAADATAPAVAQAPASAASAPAESPAPLGADVSVAGVRFVNGHVDFSDHFIRPNYSADLSELNGRLGAITTGQRDMAPLELHGRVAGTAVLDVRGALNPLVKPPALDIQARATDLELAPLSPYAGKYAGYAIERGKLSMDVSYKIEADGHLDAKNQIVLNQLTFGERIDSPDATKLPVLLAVALLKDSHGVIDLNLPIGGSINDPQFSIGGIVWKLIINLLTKALTAPFALLSGGDSEDLSRVEFLPGTAHLAESSAPILDKVAKALNDRPSLQMTVTGAVDPQQEREAIQAAWLEDRLASQWRKEQLQAVTAPEAAASAPAAYPPGERSRLVRRIYADSKLPNKPRNALGLVKDIPPTDMEALLRASFQVNTDNARDLALKRGLTVREALVARGLPSERLFLAAPRLRVSGEDDGAWTPGVLLSLATH